MSVPSDLQPDLERVGKIVASSPVVLFMKGDPELPRCGFSATAVRILELLNTPFVHVDVLKDAGAREAVKIFGDWPTIPQLYVDGELVGGCDIMREMYESGELGQLLSEHAEPGAGGAA